MATLSMYTATTGLNALSTQIDVIANNLANVNTVGFKRSRANFEDLLYLQREIAGAADASGVGRPAGTQIGLGTRIANTQMIFSQGSPVNTDQSTDMAIQGDGFFRVKIYDDVGDGYGYTRAGNFVKNSEGDLVMANSDGFRIDPPVTIPDGATDIDIASDGTVAVMMPGETESQVIGQISLYLFPNSIGLESAGKNIYLTTAASGEPVETLPGSEGAGTILSNYIEGSNVSAVEELVSLIEAQRAFELNSQVITTSDEMLQTITRLK